MKTKNKIEAWKCEHCDKEFRYESEKRRHEQSHSPQFECKVCSKKFSFLSAVRRHEKQHERNFSVHCSKCGGKFKDETLLKRHMQYAHKGTYLCSKCNSTYHSETALHTHMKTHKPESERKFRCTHDGCNKTFNFAHHLKHHALTHTSYKPHVCKQCGKRFIQLHHLKVHLRVHKPDSWLRCAELDCDKAFTNEYALRRHIATHKNKTENKKSALPKFNKSIRETRIKENVPCAAYDSLGTQQTFPKKMDIMTSLKTSMKNTVKLVNDNITSGGKELVIEDVNISHHITNPRNRFLSIEAIINSTENLLVDCKIREDSNVVAKLKTSENHVENYNGHHVPESIEIENVETSISDCQSVLGKCIVTGDSEANENCLCAQMSMVDPVTETYDAVTKNNVNVMIKINDLRCIEKRQNDANACDSCECASTCGIKNEIQGYSTYEKPELEYRNDGIIKIKEILDLDFENNESEENNAVFERKFDMTVKSVPFNSCRDVLGNCIVSGNGTIGEGCLCARMTADDQQMIAQEIEDITPCPNSTWTI